MQAPSLLQSTRAGRALAYDVSGVSRKACSRTATVSSLRAASQAPKSKRLALSPILGICSSSTSRVSSSQSRPASGRWRTRTLLDVCVCYECVASCVVNRPGCRAFDAIQAVVPVGVQGVSSSPWPLRMANSKVTAMSYRLGRSSPALRKSHSKRVMMAVSDAERMAKMMTSGRAGARLGRAWSH